MNLLDKIIPNEPFLKRGLIAAVLLHVSFGLLAYFGLPELWEPDVIEEPIHVKLATLADISAAPKTDRPSNKKPEPKPEEVAVPDKPEAKPEPPKPQKAETPPPAAAPPPPKPEPVPEKKPDPLPEKKPEKKPEEKKPDKKQEKKQQQDFNSLLNNVLQQPLPAPKAESKKKSAPVPASSGPKTDLVSEIPMTATEEDGIRQQVEANWYYDPGAQGFGEIFVEVRVSLAEDGTVTDVRVINSSNAPGFSALADASVRAVRITERFKLPQGKYWPVIVLRFRPEGLI